MWPRLVHPTKLMSRMNGKKTQKTQTLLLHTMFYMLCITYYVIYTMYYILSITLDNSSRSSAEDAGCCSSITCHHPRHVRVLRIPGMKQLSSLRPFSLVVTLIMDGGVSQVSAWLAIIDRSISSLLSQKTSRQQNTSLEQVVNKTYCCW